MSQDDIPGFTVAYEQEEIQFPVYVLIVLGVIFTAAAAALDMVGLFVLALACFGYAYYNYPLLETGRPRIGAGQYGIFVEGLGILSWRAVKSVDLVGVNLRGVVNPELHIVLSQPIERGLIADWRQRPAWRYLMRLPWTMPSADVIRIPLDPFDKSPSDIHHHFTRMSLFYRR